MKRLAITAVLLTIGIYLPPRCEAQRPTEKTAQQPSDNSQPTSITYVDNHRNEAEKEPAQNKPPNGYESPEWALVIVGIITFVVIGWQAFETHCAATATRDSILLQEIAYYQWVELVNWRSAFMAQTGERTYRVQVDLVNSTAFPVTVNEASITFGEGNTFTYSPGDDLFLTPNNPHIVEVFIALTQDQLDRWARNRLNLKVSGKITYTGVLKKRQKQSIAGSLISGMSVMKFESEFPMGPDVHDQQNKAKT
jgi:hypothetical protein